MPDISVNGIVAQRNKEPYVQLTLDGKMVLQMTMSEARKIANDFYLAASRAEADAMLLRFFQNHEFPEGASAALMLDFRDFRLGFDLDEAKGFYSEPDDDNPPAPEP
jgi:hypothetical protein